MNVSALETLAGRWPNDITQINLSQENGAAYALASVTGSLDLIKYTSQDPLDAKSIAQFATDNSFDYMPNLTQLSTLRDANSPAWSSAIIYGILAHTVKGSFDGYEVSMALLYRFDGPGETAEASDKITATIPVRRSSVIRIKLPKLFPQLVLDSNKNDKTHSSSIDMAYKQDQRLHLEGDFDAYFDFYAPVGLQVNALTVLSPNFMQILKDASSTFDAEFFGDELILVTKDPIYTPEVMQVVEAALREQLSYLRRLEASWNYTPVTTPFDKLEREFFGGSVIKIGTVRIKPATFILLVLGSMFVLFIAMVFFDSVI